MSALLPAESADLDGFHDLLRQAYAGDAVLSAAYTERMGLDRLRVLRAGEAVVGGCARFEGAQRYGDAPVSQVGLAAVFIAMERRGEGLAAALVKGFLRELHRESVALSTLYASTQVPYRRQGYEVAGDSSTFEIAPADIGLTDRRLLAWPIPLDRYVAVAQPLYAQVAARQAGWLDRGALFWDRLFRLSGEEALYAFGIGPRENPEGVVLFSQDREDGGQVLLVRDRLAIHSLAQRRIWTLLGDSRSLVKTVRWRGPSNDPLLALLPEQRARLIKQDPWLTRIVNLPLALSQRGYPAGVEGRLHLEVADEVLPENAGRFVLDVKGQRGKVEAGGRGQLTAHIRALAPLFTGRLTASQLRDLGWLDGTEAAISLAERLFAGPAPWMPDRF
jgi:predicted acetyltransferase